METKTQRKQRIVDSLLLRGFDHSEVTRIRERLVARVSCSHCEALVINGVATHESGCPNTIVNDHV